MFFVNTSTCIYTNMCPYLWQAVCVIILELSCVVFKLHAMLRDAENQLYMIQEEERASVMPLKELDSSSAQAPTTEDRYT